jgi:hypothetical protein
MKPQRVTWREFKVCIRAIFAFGVQVICTPAVLTVAAIKWARDMRMPDSQEKIMMEIDAATLARATAAAKYSLLNDYTTLTFGAAGLPDEALTLAACNIAQAVLSAVEEPSS